MSDKQLFTSILVIDDQPVAQEAVASVLTNPEYQLYFANDGMTGLQLAREILPDMILLDVMMPGMDGFEVCQQMRKDSLLAEIPILLITALDDHGSRLRGLEAGADDFLSKPIDRAELRARVATIARLHRYRSLLQNRQHFEKLTELPPDCILIVDMTGKIFFANSAARICLLASANADILNRNLEDWLTQQNPDGSNPESLSKKLLEIHNLSSPNHELGAFTVRGSQPLVTLDVHAAPILWNDQPMIQILAHDVSIYICQEYKLRQLGETLKRKNRRLEELSHRLLEVQEAERRFLATELHDEVGETLTGLKLMLEMATRFPESTQENLNNALTYLTELTEHVRSLSLDLRPAMLDDFGLFSALEWLFQRYQEQTNIHVQHNLDILSESRFLPSVETAAFRIIQEALTNIARHAEVNQANVQIYVLPNWLQLEISDSGKGFQQEDLESGIQIRSSGLYGMRERASLLGGQLSIQSTPGKGTIIHAQLPLTKE